MSDCPQLSLCLPEIPLLQLSACANTVVTVTGSNPINPVNFTGIGGFNVFTSGGFVFLQGGGSVSGDYITSAQTGQFASYTALYNSGQLLLSLITASSAGVASLNGGSGVLDLVGAGNVTVTRVGQNITISGDTGAYANFASLIDLAATGAKITSLSGFVGQASGGLQSQIAQTSGVLAANIAQSGSQAWNAANANAFNLSGQLTQTGVALGSQIVATGTSAVVHANGIGSGLSGQLNALSGHVGNVSGALQAQITAGAGSQVRVTGSITLPIANLTGQGGLIVYSVGDTVYFSGGAGAGTVTQQQFDALSGNLGLSGANLYALITGLSGQIVTNFATKEQLTNSGVALGGQITALSGFTTSVSGFLQNQISALPTMAQLIATGNAAVAHANGVGSILSGNLAQTGTTLYTIITGASGQSVTDYATKLSLAQTGSDLYVVITGMSGQGVIDYATKLNLALTGSYLYQTLVGLSGVATALVVGTGNSGVLHANGIGINLSGNLTQTGATLNAQTLGLSGYLISLISAASAGVSAINGQSGVLNLIGTGGIVVITQGQDIFVSGNLDPANFPTTAMVTGMSGALVSQIVATGNAAVTHANGVGSSLSGALTNTGVTLLTIITGLSGDSNSAFIRNVSATGFLTPMITGMSGMQYVLFPFAFVRNPYVQITAQYANWANGMYGLGTSGISTSGTYVLYSDNVLETGNSLHFWCSV